MIDRHVPRPRDLRPLWRIDHHRGPWAFASAVVGSHDQGAGAAGPGPGTRQWFEICPVRWWKRPSYAQIVAWTCQDHPGEVHAELQRQVATEARAPRGRRIAADSVPLTPRFLAAGLALVDAIITGVAGTTAKSPAPAR